MFLAAKNWEEDIIKLLLDYPQIDLNFVPKINEDDDEYDDFGNRKEDILKENQIIDQNRPAHTLASEKLYEIKRKKQNPNRTLLITACQNNSFDIVKRLLHLSEKNVFDVNGVDSFDEMAPLHYICQDGKMNLFELFVDFEKNNPNIINWNIQNKNGMTPLHLACRSQNIKIVDILINDEIVSPNVDTNAVATGEFEDGRTPLNFACEKGDIEIVRLLLDEKEEKAYDPFSFGNNQNVNSQIVVRGSLCGAKSICDVTIKAKGAHQKDNQSIYCFSFILRTLIKKI